MRFVKMQGLGNDYIYVNGFQERIQDPAALAPKISDRHFGIGGDGLILILPPDPSRDQAGTAHVKMQMFNADGSQAEMCGNGIRCVCKLVHDHGICDANPLRVQTDCGTLTLTYTLDTENKVSQVTVDMGEPILAPAKIPVDVSVLPEGLQQLIDHPIQPLIDWPKHLDTSWIQASGLDQKITCISMGNPHVVLFCQSVHKVPLQQVGPVLETHPLFPNRTNVHFVQVDAPDELTMRTWERGSGATLACGTGAAAVCAAGVLTGRTERHVTAHLPGGVLALRWEDADNHVYMTGSAVEVFTGQWNGPLK